MVVYKVVFNLLFQLEEYQNFYLCFMYGMYIVFEREKYYYFILLMVILIGLDMKIFINNLLQCNICILLLNVLNKFKSE